MIPTHQIGREALANWRDRLENHPLYARIRTFSDLRIFMEHHVYSVWDFMSIIKYLQKEISPAEFPWRPRGEPSVRRFINALVLEEESDQIAVEGDCERAFSHFELYLEAMEEVGANTRTVRKFLVNLERDGLDALDNGEIPAPSRDFTKTTFQFLQSGKPHVAAASLALGREHIVPAMFRSLLGRMGIGKSDAPRFHLYLNRHVQIDEDFHAPLSLRLLNALCGQDADRRLEALEGAEKALQARIHLWDGVLAVLR